MYRCRGHVRPMRVLVPPLPASAPAGREACRVLVPPLKLDLLAAPGCQLAAGGPTPLVAGWPLGDPPNPSNQSPLMQ